jgi:hypothetical protein
LVDLETLIDDAARYCYHHLLQKVQVHCEPEALKMWAGCCAEKVLYWTADGYCPSPEVLPGAAE